MRSSSRLVKGTALLLCAMAVAASPVMAGGARYFHSKDKQGNRIVLRATEHRVLSGTFLAAGKRTLKCSYGSVLVGGFPIKSAKITDGRFHTVANGYIGEGGSWRLVLRGAFRGAAMRGSLAFHFVNRSPEDSFECWERTGPEGSLGALHGKSRPIDSAQFSARLDRPLGRSAGDRLSARRVAARRRHACQRSPTLFSARRDARFEGSTMLYVMVGFPDWLRASPRS